MKQKTNFVEEIINKLFKEKEIQFNEKIKLKDIDEEMKMQIVKFICYKDGKLSIKNLYEYQNVLKDSGIKFLEKLANSKLKLCEIITSYEPENYLEIKNNKLFKIYLNLTKKELIPFFMMMGLYSYINLRKNNLKAVKEMESNQYFEKAKNKYINLKNLFLSHIIKKYSRYDDLFIEGEEEEFEDKETFNNISYKYFFESYACFNEMFGKGDLFYLVDSIFTAITENINTIYLAKGNDFENINSLCDALFDNIYESINLCYYNDNNIDILIKTLYDTIKEYKEYTFDINYIIFVEAYCNKFKEVQLNEKLYLVCSFFKGLNPLNFENTFKEINYCHGKDHFNNIDKYYRQIYPKSDKDEMSESSEEITNNSNEKKEDSLGHLDDIKEKKSLKNISYINYNTIGQSDINTSKEDSINKDNKGNNDKQEYNIIKEDDNENNKIGSTIEDNKVNNKSQEKNIIKEDDNENNKVGSTNGNNISNNEIQEYNIIKEDDNENNKIGSIIEDNKVNNKSQEKNEIKEDDNENNKIGSTNKDNNSNNEKKGQKIKSNKAYDETRVNQKIESKSNNDGETNIKDISYLFEKIKKLVSEIEYFKESKKESEQKFIEYDKKLKESNKECEKLKESYKECEKKLLEHDKKLKESLKSKKACEKKIKKTEKEVNNLKDCISTQKKEYNISIQKLKKEIFELKSEMKTIKFRDISKMIINNYISKYLNLIKEINNKKDKAYKIADFLNGNEKLYYMTLINKYYESNKSSHITGYIEEYKKKDIIGLSKDDDITRKLINEYISTIFQIKNDENFSEK